ncbi:hypothetical protein CICLE_v10031794mg [Citrus x clementina]|uniref:GrpE protein homolog n=2 Tax=Citrus clementina TaxID=85681 RepID=V4VDM3_CITCL|nr:hypothetical protein CICLE_v10031794mg [Citrus x clementina]
MEQVERCSKGLCFNCDEQFNLYFHPLTTLRPYLSPSLSQPLQSMATVIKTPPFHASSLPATRAAPISLKSPKPICISFRQRLISTSRLYHRSNSLRFVSVQSLRFVKFSPLASTGETETQEEIQEPQIEESSDGAVGIEDGTSDDDSSGATSDDTSDAEEAPTSFIMETFQSYKEALASNDDTKAAEIEALLKSFEDEKIDLERKVVNLSEELSAERARILRISADFDNFRKRTEKERLSLVTNAQGEVMERLLQVLDNFERAKTQIKVQTEGEEKINNSYQSIYKQLVEILGSLGVVPVETVGNPFDPLVKPRVGLKISRVLDEFSQILNQVCSGFVKTWIRF